jgi:hypothetical protein
MGFSRQGEIYCDETSNEKAGMLIHTGHCRRCEFPNRLIPRRVAPQQSPLPLRRVINYTQSQQVSRRAARGAAWVRLLEGPFSRRRKRASRLWHDFPLDIEGPHISRDLASRHRTTHRGMGWDPGKRLTVRRVDKLIGIRAGGGISRGLDELAGRHRVGSNGVGARPKRIGCAGCCRCPRTNSGPNHNAVHFRVQYPTAAAKHVGRFDRRIGCLC